MFGFGKSKGVSKAASSQPTILPQENDLLASSEDAEFEASVQQAKERARQRQSASSAPVIKPAEEEIVWNEQQDVYRPTATDVADFLRSYAPGRSVTVKRGQSIIITRQAAFDKIQAHLRSDLRIELGGLLIGRVLNDSTRSIYLILIEDALPAVEGHGTAISFEYTSASWKAITPQLQQMNADQTIVGSYHSHPGLGVFMSATDRDTQSDIFDHEWQIALVIDPIREQVGFFIGVEGTPCLEWHLLQD